jgi:hypothetical protein
MCAVLFASERCKYHSEKHKYIPEQVVYLSILSGSTWSSASVRVLPAEFDSDSCSVYQPIPLPFVTLSQFPPKFSDLYST